MKHTSYILAGMAVLAAAFTACSDDDNGGVEDLAKNAIAFNVTVPKATRAVTDIDNLNEFTVWSFVDRKPFMSGVEVSKKDNVWSYSPVMYWPADGKTVNFFSVSPNIGSKGMTSPDRTDIPAYDNSKGNVDLLYAVNMDESRSPVAVNFRHALSQVQFSLKRDNSGTPLQIVVSGVELLNTASVGDFTYPRETTSSTTASTVRGTWSGQKSPKNVTVYTSNAQNGTTLADTTQTLNSSGYMFAIPQVLEASTSSYTGAYVRVRCAIFAETSGVKLWPSTTDEGYSDIDGSAYIYFPLRSETATVTTWEPGKAYNYTLTVGVPSGTGTIEFDVTVDSYSDFIDSDI